MKKHVFCRHNSEFEVQFFDVDSMDIMWHGHYVKYLEIVEYETCLRIDYVIFDAKTNQKLTTASTTQVAVSMQTREMQLQTPPCWQSAVKTHPTFVSEGE